MATRFYLPSSGASPLNPAVQGAWNETANADATPLLAVTTKTNTAPASKQLTKAVTAGTYALARRYVSQPIAAQTITASTIRGRIRALENAANNNLDIVRIGVYVVTSAGALRGTILALGNYVAALEFATTLTNRGMADGDATSSVVCSDGDRLVFEIGIGNTAAGTNPNGSLSFGDNSATDLPENTTTTTADNPWIELAYNVVFLSTVTSSTALPLGANSKVSVNNLMTVGTEDDFSHANWTKAGTTVVTANNASDPDSDLQADTITFPGGGDHIGLYATLNSWLLAQAGTSLQARVWLRVTSGTATIDFALYDDVNGYRTSQKTITTTWAEYSITEAVAAGATDIRIVLGAIVAGSTSATFQFSTMNVSEAVSPRLINSSTPLPLGWSAAVIANPVSITASNRVPLGLTAALEHPVLVAATTALPLAATVDIDNPLFIGGTTALPLGLVAEITGASTLFVTSATPLPLGVAVDIDNPTAMQSTTAVPLQATVDIDNPEQIASTTALPLQLTAHINLEGAELFIVSNTPLPLGLIALLETEPITPPPSDTIYGGGGGGTISGRSRAKFARAVAESLYRPEPQPRRRAPAPAPKPPKREPAIRAIERAIRLLRIPQPAKEAALEQLKTEPTLLPSIRGIAIAQGNRTRATMGAVQVEAGSTAAPGPIVTKTRYGFVEGEGIQNPTDEQLIELLVSG